MPKLPRECNICSLGKMCTKNIMVKNNNLIS